MEDDVLGSPSLLCLAAGRGVCNKGQDESAGTKALPQVFSAAARLWEQGQCGEGLGDTLYIGTLEGDRELWLAAVRVC